jgi:hypothetical protein
MTPAEFNRVNKMRALILAEVPYLKKELKRINSELVGWEGHDPTLTCDEVAVMIEHLYQKHVEDVPLPHGYDNDGERLPGRPPGVVANVEKEGEDNE